MTSQIRDDVADLQRTCRSVLEIAQDALLRYEKRYYGTDTGTLPKVEIGSEEHTRRIDQLGYYYNQIEQVSHISGVMGAGEPPWFGYWDGVTDTPEQAIEQFKDIFDESHNIYDEANSFIKNTSLGLVPELPRITYYTRQFDRINSLEIFNLSYYDILVLDFIALNLMANYDQEDADKLHEDADKLYEEAEKKLNLIKNIINSVHQASIGNENLLEAYSNINVIHFSNSFGRNGLKSDDDETRSMVKSFITLHQRKTSESGSISPTPNTSPHTVCGTILLEADGFYSYREGYGAMSYEQYLLDLGTNGVSKPQAQPAAFNISSEKSWLNYLADKVWLVALPTSVATGEAATAGGAGAFVAKSAPALKNFAMRSSPYAIGAGVVLYMANEALDHAYHPGIENMNYTVSNEYYNQQVLGYNLNGQDYEINTNPLMNELGYQNHQFDLNSAMGHGSHDTMQDMVLVTYDKSDYTKDDIRKIYKGMGITLSDG